MTPIDHQHFMAEALREARQGLAEGGIPIGSVLVIDGEIVGRGHNRRVQRGSAVLHAEMDCLENAGRLRPAQYRRAVLYSTLAGGGILITLTHSQISTGISRSVRA